MALSPQPKDSVGPFSALILFAVRASLNVTPVVWLCGLGIFMFCDAYVLGSVQK